MGTRGKLPKSKQGDKLKAPAGWPPGVPGVPNWLDDVASIEYIRIVELFKGKGDDWGGLAQQDWWLVGVYAQAFSDVRRLTLSTRGNETVQTAHGVASNPECRELAKAHDRMMKTALELGFSPRERKKQKKDAENQRLNPFLGRMGES